MSTILTVAVVLAVAALIAWLWRRRMKRAASIELARGTDVVGRVGGTFLGLGRA